MTVFLTLSLEYFESRVLQSSASYYNTRAITCKSNNVYDKDRNDTGSACSTNSECD